MASALIVKLCNVTRPQSGKVDFQRWKAAIPNEAGSCFGQRDDNGKLLTVPSFRAPYFVDESSDMLAGSIDHRVTANFLLDLERQGYTKITMV